MLAIFWLLTALVWPLKTTHMHLCVCVCCLPWQRCCSERWLCCSRNDCLYSTLLLSFVAKNNPAPQDKEGSTEEVIPLPPSRNYPTLPPSLDLIFFPLSFIIYTLIHFPSVMVSSLSLPQSPALRFHCHCSVPSENGPVTMQAQLTGSAHRLSRCGWNWLCFSSIKYNWGDLNTGPFLSPCV